VEWSEQAFLAGRNANTKTRRFEVGRNKETCVIMLIGGELCIAGKKEISEA